MTPHLPGMLAALVAPAIVLIGIATVAVMRRLNQEHGATPSEHSADRKVNHARI